MTTKEIVMWALAAIGGVCGVAAAWKGVDLWAALLAASVWFNGAAGLMGWKGAAK